MEEAIDLEGLSRRLDDEPGAIAWALDGLDAIDPGAQGSLVRALGSGSAGPGTVDFLRLLCFSDDPSVRNTALATLDDLDANRSDVIQTWLRLAVEHPEAGVRSMAHSRLAAGSPVESSLCLAPAAPPRILRGLCSSVDAHGTARIAIVAIDRDQTVAAIYACHMLKGVQSIIGQVGPGIAEIESMAVDFAASAPEPGIVADIPLAVQLVSGSLLLCSPRTTPSRRFWIEKTLGPRFTPVPLATPIVGVDPSSLAHSEMHQRVCDVLDVCPGWLDSSPLTLEIAREIAIREGDAEPDPGRDAGAYRYLFEHALVHRLELDRRKLLWMALFWEARGETERSRSARLIAYQLSDPQHVVPSHPFLVELSTRSLIAAARVNGNIHK